MSTVGASSTHIVGRFADMPSGTARRVDLDGVAVAVVRIDDAVYAISDICSHANVSLSGGEVWCDELELECPKHGSTFSLVSGVPSTLPATQPVAVFDAAIVDGDVVVTITEQTDPHDATNDAASTEGRAAS